MTNTYPSILFTSHMNHEGKNAYLHSLDQQHSL